MLYSFDGFDTHSHFLTPFWFQSGNLVAYELLHLDTHTDSISQF